MKRLGLCLFFLFVIITKGLCQTIINDPALVDELSNKLGKKLRYPPMARDSLVTGQVLVAFDITRQGFLNNFVVVKNLKYGCDVEIKRALTIVAPFAVKPGHYSGLVDFEMMDGDGYVHDSAENISTHPLLDTKKYLFAIQVCGFEKIK